MHRIPFSQVPPQQQIPNMSNFDPATYMSPMDLYDSIFWGMPASTQPHRCRVS